MEYTTYFLRFSSEKEANDTLREVGYRKYNRRTKQYDFSTLNQPGDVDVIGEIYNDDEVFRLGKKGYHITITPATKKDGYHVNITLKGELPEALKEFCVIPQNPHRVFL
jgi:hypothetical protein